MLDNNEIIAIVNFKYGSRPTPRVADAPTRAATKVRPAPEAEGGGTAGPNAERNRAKRQRRLERERNDRPNWFLSVLSDQILAHLLTPTQTPQEGLAKGAKEARARPKAKHEDTLRVPKMILGEQAPQCRSPL